MTGNTDNVTANTQVTQIAVSQICKGIPDYQTQDESATVALAISSGTPSLILIRTNLITVVHRMPLAVNLLDIFKCFTFLKTFGTDGCWPDEWRISVTLASRFLLFKATKGTLAAPWTISTVQQPNWWDKRFYSSSEPKLLNLVFYSSYDSKHNLLLHICSLTGAAEEFLWLHAVMLTSVQEETSKFLQTRQEDSHLQ